MTMTMTMNFISNLYKLHYITQFTSIYIINIDNKVIQIGGKSITIYSCLPTFPLEKKKKKKKKINNNIVYSRKHDIAPFLKHGNCIHNIYHLVCIYTISLIYKSQHIYVCLNGC